MRHSKFAGVSSFLQFARRHLGLSIAYGPARRKSRLRLRLEPLEQRQMLSVNPGEWLADIAGLAGNTRDSQIAAAQVLLDGAGLTNDVQIVKHMGADGILLIETPPEVTSDELNAELKNVAGFVYVEPYDRDAEPDERRSQFPLSPEDEDEGEDPDGASDPVIADTNPPETTGTITGPNVVTGLSGFDGIIAGQAGNFRPPDTDGAVGPNSFVAAVNSAVAIYSKNGTALTSVTTFGTFFSSLGSTLSFSDPIVVYNDITQRFFVGMLDFDSTHMFLDVGISRSSNPTTLTSADWNYFRYNVNDGVGAAFDFADYPKLGYNADGYVVSFNMFPSSYDHVSLIGIQNNGASAGITVLPGGFSRFTLAPASMHGSAPGSPMYFMDASSGGASTVEVVRMDNPYSATPTYTFTNVPVTTYSSTVSPHQPGGQLTGNSNLGTRMYFSASRNVGGTTHLLSAHTVGDGSGYSRVRWYDIDITSGTPSLLQQGQVNPGGNVDTLFPSIDISPDGTLGLQYLQSSSTEFVSMYTTGRQPGDPLNTMQTPLLVRAGTANITPNDRIGDYSFTSVDPVDGTFWGTNMYANSSVASPNWRTWIQNWQLGLSVSTTIPAVGSTVNSPPTSFTINTSQAVTPASVNASDLLINGIPATSVAYTPGSTTIVFTYGTSPVVNQGLQTIHVDAGALISASDGSGIVQFDGSFRYDSLPIAVTSTTPADNSYVTLPFTDIDVNFNQAYDPASIGANDLNLSQGSVTGFTLIDSDTVRYSVTGLVGETTLTFTIAAGAILDTDGNPGLAYTGKYNLDALTTAYPTPLLAVKPTGSLIYDPSFAGSIAPANDTDSFTISLDAGQLLTAVVTAGTGFQPRIDLSGPGGANGSGDSPAAGSDAVLQSFLVTTAGTYTVRVSGLNGTSGTYSLQLILNGAVELEAHGGSPNDATPQDINSAFVSLGSGGARAAVLGTADLSAGLLATEAEPNDSLVTANEASASFSSAPVNLYQLLLRGNRSTSTDLDYFSIGALQAGDVITIAESGNPSSRGTLSDSFVYLYRGSTSAPVLVTSNDDNGPGNDSLIYRFAITTTDNYFIAGSAFSSNTGTYQVGVYLENTGSAPNLGSGVVDEVEANDTAGTATDARNSWSAVQYYSHVTASIGIAGDNDYYRYQFTAGDLVTIVGDSTSTVDMRVSLLDSAGTVLTLEDGTSVGPSVDSPIYAFRIPATGTYYLQMYATAGTGAYNADVYLTSTTSPPAPTFGKDDYAFTLSTGESVGVAINGLSASGSVFAQVIDPTGSILARSASTNSDLTGRISDVLATTSGVYRVRVQGTLGTDYSVLVTKNLDLDSQFNDSTASSQPLSAATAGGMLNVLGNISASSNVAETFDSGVLTGYTFVATNNVVLTNGAAHDGLYGMATNSGTSDWMYRTDAAAQVHQGDVISAWIRAETSGTAGKAYLGFGASAAGALSLVMAPNANQIQIQNNAAYSFTTLATATQTWLPNHWYRFEVNWGLGGTIVGKVYDSDGVTLLNTVTATDNSITSGGLAFRAFNQVYDFDTVVTKPHTPTYSVSLTAGTTLQASTSTPGDGSGEPVNSFDAKVLLYNSVGTLVAADDNSAADGRNAQLSYTVPAGGSGLYYLQVVSSPLAAPPNIGSYVLSVAGANSYRPAFNVVNSSPAANSQLSTYPSSVTINFNDSVLLTSLSASDVTFGGQAATSVTVLDGDSIAFGLPTGFSDGVYNVSIAAGAIQDAQGTPVNAIAFPLVINQFNSAPVLDASGNPFLPQIDEDATSPVGVTINGLLATGAGGNPISDTDAGAIQGIAVTAVDNTNGAWQFSLDGASWTAFGTPAASVARLLASDGTSRVRFVPNTNFAGSVPTGISFRAWDQSTGVNGSTVSTLSNGGTTAFSTAIETASISVTEVNDLPVRLTGNVSPLEPVHDSGATSLGLGAVTYGPGGGVDEAGQSLVFQVQTVPNATVGTIVRAGNLIPLAVNDTLTVNELQGLRFNATSNVGVGTFTYRVTDNGTTGGVSAPQSINESITITVDHQLRVTPTIDINSTPGSSDPGNAVTLNNIAIYTAFDPVTGVELWRSDGTCAGTYLLKDIRVGKNSSSISNLTLVGNQAFFSANDLTNGTELWKTDGTNSGTVLVKDIVTSTYISSSGVLGGSGSGPTNLVNVNGILYFSAFDSSAFTELFRSDGTSSGTFLVKDINTSVSSFPSNLVNVGGTLYFKATDATNGTELWKSNGTSTGTTLVADITAGAASSTLTNFAAVGNLLFFDLSDTNGNELWRSDGTSSGTALVLDINPGSVSSNPVGLTNVNNTLFFVATQAATGTELWRSDGTSSGTQIVADLVAGSGSGSSTVPATPVNINGILYFAATNGVSGTELWRSDGSNSGTTLVADLFSGGNSSLPLYLTEVNGVLYFSAASSPNGREMFASNGTSSGTYLVRDLIAGTTSSSPTNFANMGGMLFFRGNDNVTGRELWTSDGTSSGTALIRDMNTSTADSSPRNMVNLGNTLLFSADDGVGGRELWRANGTSTGTFLVKDIAGLSALAPTNMVTVGNLVFFAGFDTTNSTELWRSDGTSVGTFLVKDIRAGGNPSSPSSLTNVNGVLYFSADDGISGRELWKSDGTCNGTVMVADILAGSGAGIASSFTTLVGAGDLVFFTSSANSSGTELWRSDGTSAGTFIVSDILPGASSSSPVNITAIGNYVYFSATDGVNGSELWRSDGTSSGTTLVADISAGASSSSPGNFTSLNGNIIFTAFTSANFTELWRTDGTSSGTTLVRDINVGSNSSFPGQLTNVNGTLYFYAYDSVSAFELWKSDGTSSGTVQVRDIAPGIQPVGPNQFRAVGDQLVFRANDGVNGFELWRSSGSSSGTVMITDLFAGPPDSYPNYLFNANGRLFFTGANGANGIELYSYRDAPPTTTGMSDVNVFVNTPSTNINLFVPFEDDISPDAALTYTVVGNTNPTLVSATTIDPSTGTLTLNYAPNVIGTTVITVRATDPAGQSVQSSFNVTSLPITSLRVATLTPTNTGFRATLTKAIDPSVLNLYTTQAIAAAADVTLVGSVSGAIRGSIVINDAGNGFTFVATTGLIPTGESYTVTLRSSASGFVTPLGEILDGNGDGTTGDDYATTFVASAAAGNARTVSLPNLARGYGQTINSPANSTNGIPVSINNGASVQSVSFDLAFDPTLLTITGVTATAGVTGGVTFNAVTPGLLHVSYSGATEIGSGLTNFVNIQGSVPNAALYGSKEVLDLQNVVINGGAIPALDDDAVHVAAYLGDATGSRAYSGLDAALISRVSGALDSGFSTYPMLDPVILGDISADGNLTGLDANLVSQKVIGLAVTQVPDLPTGITPPGSGAPDTRLYIPQNLSGQIGHTTTVPISLDVTEAGGVSLQSGDFAVSFDPTQFSVTNVRLGSLDGTGFSLNANVNNATGTITVSSFANGAPRNLSFGTTGSVVLMDFTVLAGASLGNSVIDLEQNIGPTTTALNEGALALTPAPTNSSNDAVDGVLKILDNLPLVTLAVSPNSFRENGGTTIVSALLSQTGSEAVVVNLALTGSAVNGGDYNASNLSITVPAGSLSGFITLTAINDTTFEGPESVVIDIATVIYGLENGSQSVAAIITDDDSQPSVSIVFDAVPKIVRDINYYVPTNLVDVNGTAFFTLSTVDEGIELWKSDGSNTGTVLVKDIWPGASSSHPRYLTNVNGTLFFQAHDANNDYELWKSDGTSLGTVRVKDIRGGNVSSSPLFLTNVNGTLYFEANDGTHGYELWKSDGSSTGTLLVKDIRPGSIGAYIGFFTNVNGTLYFQATDGANGYELWKSDGSSTGTVLVKNIGPGAANANLNYLTNVNGKLYFQAFDGIHGSELWKSDGSSSGTVLVADIIPGAGEGYPRNLTNVNGTLYFQANDGIHGKELWKSDGSSTGTVLVKDILPGLLYGAPELLTNVNGTLYFQANGGIHPSALWKSDGSSAGTVLVEDIDIRTFPGIDQRYLTNVNGTLYFWAYFGPHDYELWKSDGSSSGTMVVSDTIPISNGTSRLTNVNGTLYFSVSDGTSGSKLWALSPRQNITSIAENGGTATVTATLTNPSSQDVTVQLAFSGTATNLADYSRSGTSIVILAGNTAGSITLTGVDDATFEGAESIVVDISSVANGVENGTQQITATMVDDDSAPQVNLSVFSSILNENGGTATVTATLTNPSTQNVAVQLAFTGTATSAIDYSANSAVITILAGNTAGSITLTGVNDSIYEGVAPETIIVDVSNVTGGVENGTQQVTIGIVDDEAAPTVQFGSLISSVNEGLGTFAINVFQSSLSVFATSIPFTLGGTANAADRTISGSPLIIPAGQTSVAIVVTVFNDVLDEANETVTLTLGVPDNGILGINTTHTLTIIDNDPAPLVQFTVAGQSVGESTPAARAIVRLSAVSGLDVTVPITVSGTADAADATVTSTFPLVIPAGQISAPIDVSILDDIVAEPTETLVFTIGAPSKATLGAINTHTLSIVDNDSLVTVNFATASFNAGEAVGSVPVIVTLSSLSLSDVTIPLTLGGSASSGDYVVSTTNVTIPAGQTRAIFTIAITDDQIDETSETLNISLGAPVSAALGTNTSVTITIDDNDPVLSFVRGSETSLTENGTITIVARTLSPVISDLAVPFITTGKAVNGVDFTLSANQFQFLSGSSTAAITLTIIDDTAVEGSESVTLQLQPPANTSLGSPGFYTLFISDNDSPVTPGLDLNGPADGQDFLSPTGEYIEDTPASILAPNATVSPPGVQTLNSIVVYLESAPNGSSESLSATNSGGATATAYNSTTRTLTISGGTVSDQQSVLRSVAYQNTSQAPSAGGRFVTFTANFSGSVDSRRRKLVVTPVDDAPIVTTTSGAGLFVTGSAPILVDSGITLTDVEENRLVRAVVTLTDAESGDALSLSSPVAGFTSTVVGNVMTITANAGSGNLAAFRIALSRVQFTTTTVGDGSRSVSFIVTDTSDIAGVADATSLAATRSITVQSPLLVESSPLNSAAARESLTIAQLQPLVTAAIARWESAGATATQLAVLRAATIEVRDLADPNTLGLGGGSTIVLDTNAAGHGWFIDSTPTVDEEFDIPVAVSESRASTGVAVDRIDLLTTVMHEFGHLLGFDDVGSSADNHSLLHESLGIGVRHTPTAAELSLYFERLGS